MSVSAGRSQPILGPKERFFTYFKQEAIALQEEMARLKDISTTGGERTDAIDHCLSGIARLQKEVQDASSYVPSYDQRTYGQAIKGLNEKLDETRTALAPKSKFTFKTRKNNSAISLSDAAELASQQRARIPGYRPEMTSSAESSIATTPDSLATPPNELTSKPEKPEPLRRGSLGQFLKTAGIESTSPVMPQHVASIRKMSFASSNSVNISNHTGLHIILPSSAAHATSSGSLTNLRNCIVDMSVPTATGQPFAGLTIKSIKNSLLICGNVSGSTHITGVEGSVILVTTRQFRMHECKDCVVYLHVNSRPIIEDCQGIQFAPLPHSYIHFTHNMSSSNQWNQVQDFKWLKSAPSPNWSILPAEQIVTDDTWTAVIPGRPDLSLADILKAAGVAKLSEV